MKQAATLFLSLFLLAPWAVLGAQETKPAQTAAKATENLPEASIFRLMAAELALDRENPEVALANYIAAAKETQDASIAARATQIALSVSSIEAAVEPATIWAKADPKNLEAQITTAALFIRLGDAAKAAPYLQKGADIDPDEALQYYLVLYKQLQKDEESKEVIKALEMVSKQEKKDPAASLALSEIYLFTGKNKEALAMAQQALKLKPDSVMGIQLCTEALFKTENKTAAKSFLEQKVKQVNDQILKQYYSQFLFDNGFQQQAKAEIEALAKNPNLSGEDLLNYARLSMQAQWYDLANQLLQRSVKMEKTKELSYYFLARLNEMQSKDDAAINWFKQVTSGPFHVLSQIRASVLLTEKKNYDDALAVLSKTQANDPSDQKQVLLATVEVYNKSKKFPQALTLLNENMESDDQDIELLYARSLVEDKLDKVDLAEKDLKAILAISPNHIDALNAMGYILANKTKRFDDAQTYLNRALELSPTNAQVLDSLGWMYYQMGKYNQALEMLQKAAEITPDAEIAAHLGEVMWQMKDFEGAKKVWSAALQNYPTHENIISAMKRLMTKQAVK